MQIEYKLDSQYVTLMTLLSRGVVLNRMFQLFDLERDKSWECYPDFEPMPNPEYNPESPDDDIYESVYRGSYGVCDSLGNLLEVYPELEYEGENCRKFVISLTRIEKEDQPSDGGWRWHKWGRYIGSQNSVCEYIYDEPLIDFVYCYHIYEKVKDD